MIKVFRLSLFLLSAVPAVSIAQQSAIYTHDLKEFEKAQALYKDKQYQSAQIIFEKDEKLEQPQHRLLARQVENFWNNKSDLS